MIASSARSLRSLALVCALGAAALTSFAARADAPKELDEEVKALFHVAACDGQNTDARFDKAVVDEHCADLAKIMARYKKEWLAPARPFFDELVPKGIPTTVVYPFAGGDLMTALAVFPNLTDITTISLEAGGDARGIFREDKKALKKHLALHRRFINELVEWNHNRTLDLAALKSTPLASQLIFALVGLSVHGFEPVGLRSITLEKDGSIHYLTEKEFAAYDKQLDGKSGGVKNRALNDLLASYELRFRKKGETTVRTYRHFQQNLANDELAKDPRILKYLDTKGKVTAMTKAASHLLWHGAFKTIREWLKDHMQWMVSDSTGILPIHLDATKWEQLTYGTFDTAVFNPSTEGQKAMRALFASQPKRTLPMKLFGYPMKSVKGFLMVTRPK